MSDSIEDRLGAIEMRNARVALDKQWETSLTRKLAISVITYFVAALVMCFVLRSHDWMLGAFIPVIGYLLSTLSLPVVRRMWESKK